MGHSGSSNVIVEIERKLYDLAPNLLDPMLNQPRTIALLPDVLSMLPKHDIELPQNPPDQIPQVLSLLDSLSGMP